jgi:MFS family permease
MLQLSNTQIAYFVITSGIVSALVLPVARRWMERFGVTKIYSAAVLGMAVCILPYGFVKPLWLLIIMQGFIGMCLSVNEVSTNSVMMEEAGKHSREMDYFSDFQLVINLGNAVGALLTGLLISVFPVWLCFVLIFALRLVFFCSIKLKLPVRKLAKNAAA